MLVINSIKSKDHDLTKNYSKIALGTSFLTRIISSARNILLLTVMQFYEQDICQIMIFRLYTVYNKHEMIKIGNQTREISQALSQVLE